MQVIRWGIIGCGDVCEVKSGPGFQKAEGSALVAVMRRDAARAADFARRHGVARHYHDAAALIADPEVDAVYIATPPSSHAELTEQVAAAGKPVYVEKPMARNRQECQRMVDACARAGVPLFVAYYRRALPRFTTIKTLLDEGAIGQVQAASFTLVQPAAPEHQGGQDLPWRLDPEVAGAGLFLDLASHMIDLADFLLGPIAEARGRASNRAGLYRAEDTVSGELRFSSGAHATGLWSFASGVRLDRSEIFGSRGRITFSMFDDEPVVVATGDGQRSLTIPHPPHVQQPLIQNVVDCLRGRAVTAISTGDNGLRATEVMDALLRTFRNSRPISGEAS